MITSDTSPWSFLSTTFLLALVCAASVPAGMVLLLWGSFTLGGSRSSQQVVMLIVGIALPLVGSVAVARSLTTLLGAIVSSISGLCVAACIALIITLVGGGDRTLLYASLVAASASMQIAALHLFTLDSHAALCGLLIGLVSGVALVIGTLPLVPKVYLSEFPVFFVWYAWTAIVWISGAVGRYVGSTKRADWVVVAWAICCSVLLAAVWALN